MIITIRIEEDWGRRKKEERDEKVKKKKSKERARQGSSKKAGIGLTGKGVYGRGGNKREDGEKYKKGIKKKEKT